MNTSQLYQLISVGLVSAFPHHYNAAAIFWSAACISLSWLLLWRAMGAGVIQGFAAFVLLSAPSIFFTIGTGMETATVLLIVVLTLGTLLGVGLLSLAFLAYYGTPVPLAAYHHRAPFADPAGPSSSHPAPCACAGWLRRTRPQSSSLLP